MIRPVVKQPLLLLHGINSQGEWYRDIESVMRPFFDCHRARYHQFRHDKLALRVAFDRRAREAALRLIKRNTTDISQHTRPCVIAHSLGTYMTWRLLQDGYLFGKVVFIGSVLSRETDWSVLEHGFESILNEVANRDAVAGTAAPLLGVFDKEFGSAGQDGFINSNGSCHDVIATTGKCELCGFGTQLGDVRVHNLRVPSRFTHSTATEGRIQAENFWLPFLRGMVPFEARAFTSFVRAANTCLQRAGLEERAGESLALDHPLLKGFAQTCNTFMATKWAWCMLDGQPRSAWEFLDLHLSAACSAFSVEPDEMERLRALALHRVVQLGVLAIEEIQGASQGGGPERDEKARCIAPPIAFYRACQRTARELGSSRKP